MQIANWISLDQTKMNLMQKIGMAKLAVHFSESFHSIMISIQNVNILVIFFASNFHSHACKMNEYENK